MSTTINQQQTTHSATQRPASDPLVILLLVLVIGMLLGGGLYLCVIHPVLTAPIAAVGAVGSALAPVVIASFRRR